MKLVIGEFEQEQWQKISSEFNGLSLLQTWEYGQAKIATGSWKNISRMLFLQGNQIVGAAQGCIQTVFGLKKGVVWINRAPLWQLKGKAGDVATLKTMLQELQDYWVQKRGMYLRVAPPLLGENGSRALIEETGFNLCRPPIAWVSELIDLSKSIDELRAGLRQKWRNCLNKSERLGLSCEAGTSSDLLNSLFDDYRNLLCRKTFRSNLTVDFIQTMQNFLPQRQKMWVFKARLDEKNLGSILIVGYGETCMYYIGAVNNEGRKSNATYFLLWQAICKMKELGYKWFDVGGANPDKTPSGILHFKQGLGGRPYRLVGEFEAHNNSLTSRIIRWRVNKKRQ